MVKISRSFRFRQFEGSKLLEEYEKFVSSVKNIEKNTAEIWPNMVSLKLVECKSTKAYLLVILIARNNWGPCSHYLNASLEHGE